MVKICLACLLVASPLIGCGDTLAVAIDHPAENVAAKGDGAPAACAPACEGEATCCDGTCAHVLSDPKHCGMCEIECVRAHICTNGACVCPPAQEECHGKCVNLQANESHCGACDAACPLPRRCAAGRCL